jgi:hypothetical protein
VAKYRRVAVPEIFSWIMAREAISSPSAATRSPPYAGHKKDAATDPPYSLIGYPTSFLILVRLHILRIERINGYANVDELPRHRVVNVAQNAIAISSLHSNLLPISPRAPQYALSQKKIEEVS